MNKATLFSVFKRFRWYLFVTLLFAGGLYYYFSVANSSSETAAAYAAITVVEKGDVSSGIQTTGKIVAAQKLDIDVYKQLSRIASVSVQNGAHVSKGDIIVSFDKNDAYASVQSAKTSVLEAELALQNEIQNQNDPSSSIRSLESEMEGLKKAILDAEQSKKDTYRDFLNKNVEAVSETSRVSAQASYTPPTLTGRYVSDERGVYVVEVYASGADSGLSYRVSGLETGTFSIVTGKATDLGSRGLKLTFPATARSGDKWVVRVPNSTIATYSEAEKDYNQKISDLDKTIADAKVNLANAEQKLNYAKQTDTTAYRNLGVEKAKSSVAESRQQLLKSSDVVKDRDIIAPFSGTVEGMENVVVGATPTGGTEDPTDLGTLISDEFLTTFTLSAANVVNVSVGQKVKVTVTSFNEHPTFEAEVTQISSLPDSDGVAQYEVQALLAYDRTTASVALREGMLADIEVVQKEKTNVLRIPTSAITYENGAASVMVIDSLSEAQKAEVEKMGILKTAAGESSAAQYSVPVTLGIVGQYYAEVTSGLSEGAFVVTTSVSDSATESVVQNARFGPGPGGEQSNKNSSTNSNTSATKSSNPAP